MKNYNEKKTSKHSRRTVLYGGVFITIAVLLILLSYFMSMRNDRETEPARTNRDTVQSSSIVLTESNRRSTGGL